MFEEAMRAINDAPVENYGARWFNVGPMRLFPAYGASGMPAAMAHAVLVAKMPSEEANGLDFGSRRFNRPNDVSWEEFNKTPVREYGGLWCPINFYPTDTYELAFIRIADVIKALYAVLESEKVTA